MVQFKDVHGALLRGVYAQHSWRESCGYDEISHDNEWPVVFVANGSHAAYFKTGVHNRPWPDPNDYARADGKRIRPRLVRITRASPAWMRRRRPWGSSRATFPGEESSPRGPAFQHERFDSPAAWATGARSCGSGAPGLPALAIAGLALAGVLALAATAALIGAIRRLVTLGR